ncbi:MAG: alpha/beta fold hydrolase [Ardenticatenaceae bacterium]|nr:alpha/beta fold hydrolase [Ardenticatenaceae bacterium]
MKNWLLLIVLFIAAGLLAACDDAVVDGGMVDEETAVQSPLITAVSGAYQPADCPFNAPGRYNVACGYLTVPENRANVDSQDIQLAVAIVPAPNGAEYPPLIYLAGGPGSSALDEFDADPKGWEYPFTQNRDLIFLDQRGTGYSQPTLDCPEFADAAEGDSPDELCYERLVDEGIDLAAYNTAENAADVEALRLALGIEQWDVLGISYGTRLALQVMKDYPDGLRSVVLDSTFPPNVDTPVQDALSTMESLNRLFAECAADNYCANEYPDLESVFLDTVAALNEDETAGIYGDDLLFAVSNAFNDSESIPLLPRTIYEVADGNFAALDEIGFESGYGRFQSGNGDYSDSEGMYNSVMCADEYADGDYERAEEAVVGQIPAELEAGLLQGVYDITAVCAYWNPQQRTDNTAVSSSIPTLILSGQYDVATPTSWAYLAAKTLPNAHVYEFPGSGHSVLSGGECAIDITTQFLDNPANAPDDACIADMNWPAFE